MYASHTKLETAETCLFRYRRHYIDKVPEPRSWPLAIGGAAHAAIAAYTRHCIAQGVPTDLAAVPDVAMRACLEGDEAPGAQAVTEVTEILQTFAESHIVTSETLLGIEERIPGTWRPPESWPKEPNLGRHVFVGIIDRLDGDGTKAIVTDYKTDWHVRPQTEVERDPQLRRYAWLVSSEYKHFETFEVRLDFVRHGIMRSVEFGPDVVERTGRELLAAVDRLEATREFPATPGEGCAVCGYAAACPALRHSECLSACATPEDAQHVAAQLIVLEKRADELKGMLRAYCATAGPVTTNGVQFGHLKTVSQGVDDVAGFANRLSVVGIDPWPYLTVDRVKLKALLKKDGMPDALGDLLVDRSYTVFRSRRAGEEEAESA